MNSKNRFRWQRPLVILALIAALGIPAAYFITRADGADEAVGEGPLPPVPKVTIALVEEREVADYRELLGRVQAIESVEVRPRVSGHIGEVKLQAGQRVEKGDVLFTIDRRWYQAQFDLAEAAVARAKVRVEIAEKQARRSNDLLESRAISTEEADLRNSGLAEAKAELAAAEAGKENARLDLEHTEIRAPIRGIASRAYVTAGNMVSGTPGNGTLLTTLVSDGDVHVYADVDESTVLALHGGNREVRVTMELGDEKGFPRQGHVESLDNRLDERTGSLVLRMVFPNPDGKLLPGLSARVRLPVGEPEPKLFVSERSIGTNQSQKFVFAVGEDNKVSYRSVRLGPVVEGRRMIHEGLTAGERIVTNGVQRVAAGMTVDPQIQ